MYDGYQVLRFENNYKSKDLYLIGNEMNNRIGTGNYDKERTKFNIKYKELEKDNLYQDVKYKLESRNIEYLHKTKTNLLNGVTISGGPEFFITLGLPFKETNRKYKTGKKEGQNIRTPDIKSKNDIPKEVIKYFDESYNFLKELVGEENIVMAQVHFDEYTPHLQAYFLLVVNEVKRKCYQRDKDGNLIKEIKKDRNGKDKEYHINELKAEEKKLNKDLNNYKDKINEAKNVLETSLKDTNSDLKKKIIGYSKKLMNDFDNLTRLNTIKTYESKDKDDKITSLSIENDFYKNNRKLIKSEKIRHEQYKELFNKDEELKYYKNAFSKLSRALDIITKRRPMPYVHNYISFAESVMAGKRAREMDEEAQREFDEANKKGEDICL